MIPPPGPDGSERPAPAASPIPINHHRGAIISTSDEGEQPPKPPDIPRRLRLFRAQWIGMPLLMLIPILALLGVFGESRSIVRADTAEISAEMRYPARNRYMMPTDLQLDVTNTTAAVLDTVTVQIDSTYASRFSSLAAIPDFAQPYVIELTALRPAETRRVRVELAGHDYGRHRGAVRVSATGADTARLRLDTFIFP